MHIQNSIYVNLIASIFVFSIICWSIEALAIEYYVHPNGNDKWTGTVQDQNAQGSDGPFATIERVKSAVRNAKKSIGVNEKITIFIASGSYYLKAPLIFSFWDSGFADKEILWQGEPNGGVTISGGAQITCKKSSTAVYDCPLQERLLSQVYFDPERIKGNTPKFDLYVDNQKMTLARWPDKDWAHIKIPLNQNTQFSVMETLPTIVGLVRSAQVHIFPGNDWYDQYLSINSIDQTTNSINLTAPTAYPLASGRRFYIRNLPSLLDAPGEWLFDAAMGKITLIPAAGMVPNVAILSSLPNILIVDGANNLTFKNISLQHSSGTAITIRESSNIVFDNLDINSIGGKGIEIKKGLNVHLVNSTIHHVGAEGVEVGGGDNKTLQVSGHRIHNNHIYKMAQTILTYSPGIRVTGVGTQITHNLLEHGAGNAIILNGNEHVIEKNEIHHFCLEASDCGAIYTGRDWSWRGNVILNNYIHDIIGYGMKSVDVAKNQVVYKTPGGARGIYLDDGASGFDISGNIFENAGDMALQVGGGRDNKIYNNYFFTSNYAILLDDRWPTYDWNQNQKNLDSSPYKTALWQKKYPELGAAMRNKTWPEGNRIERNIVVTTKPSGPSLRYFVPRDSTTIADNLVWSTNGKLLVDYKVLELNKKGAGVLWSQWMAEKIEHGSIMGDPCVTINNKKMTTCPGSPVKDIGFIPLPIDIGLIQ